MRAVFVLVGVVLAASAGAAPRGKVVRIERESRGPVGTPRMCNVAADGKGFCVGPKPQVGDRIMVVDGAHVLGEVRIATSEEYGGGCGQGIVWQVTGQVELGDLSKPSQGDMVGLVDVQVDRRSGHRVAVEHAPNGATAEQIWAIDGNGDGTVDVEFTQYQCDDQGAPTPAANGLCLDVWARTPHGFDRIRQDRIRNCM